MANNKEQQKIQNQRKKEIYDILAFHIPKKDKEYLVEVAKSQHLSLGRFIKIAIVEKAKRDGMEYLVSQSDIFKKMPKEKR